jgi:hypothetical protein
MNAARLDLAEMRGSCAVKPLEAPTSRFVSLCNESSVNCAREFILAVYTAQIAAPGAPPTPPFAQIWVAKQTRPQRV